jgi:CYTH domain
MNLVCNRLDRFAPKRARALVAILVVGFWGRFSTAQETCGVEVKLLLAPSEAQNAIQALKAKKETPTHVYFFDTDSLDLLSQGVILRLRRGADSELTVKMRHPQGKAFADPSGGRESFKCEVDFVGGQGRPSYSLQTAYPETVVPDSGKALYQSLSAAQKQLLKESQASIDWSRVKRIADIQSTAWRSKSIPGFDKLALELWQFPGGQILELSTKGPPNSGPSTGDELRSLADSRGLKLNSDQRPKTTTVLEAITHARVP